MVDIPDGVLSNVAPRTLADNRTTRFLFELLTADEAFKEELNGVTLDAGTLTWNRDGKIKGAGKVRLEDVGEDIDWYADRLRITAIVNGEAWPLGVWIPTAPGQDWTGRHRGWDVELHDKLTILDQVTVTETYTLAAGVYAIDAAVALIHDAGETNLAVTESSATLTAARTWEAGTSYLTICNDLLSSAGYHTLYMDGWGQYLIRPYKAPHLRPVVETFEDGATCIYHPEFVIEQDIFEVPNRVVAVSAGTEDEAGLSATAENVNPDSPYSYSGRGDRWVTKVYTGVEATDQAALQTYADAQLVSLSSPALSTVLSIAPIPVALLDAVRFRSTVAGVDDLFVVDKIDFNLSPTKLATIDIRRVVDYAAS